MFSPGYAELLAELDSLIPRVICHPIDEETVRQAVASADRNARIEVTELAEPGRIVVFRGTIWPVTNLGAM